jgi:hypothetical protein
MRLVQAQYFTERSAFARDIASDLNQVDADAELSCARSSWGSACNSITMVRALR